MLWSGISSISTAAVIRLGPSLGHPRIVGLRRRRKMPLGVLRFGMGIIIPLLAVRKGSDPSLWQRELVEWRSHCCIV